MPLFAVICIDRPDSQPLRLATRDAHKAYVWAPGSPLRHGGPFLDEEGAMTGSLMILDVPDLAAARAFNDADPYTRAGLFRSVDIRALDCPSLQA